MFKFTVLILLFLCGCPVWWQIPGFDAGTQSAGSGASGQGGNGVAGTSVAPDAGVAGSAGSSGISGSGAGGSTHNHGGAGSAGSASNIGGAGGSHDAAHGGIVITGTLPASVAGSTTFDVSSTTEQPTVTDEPGAVRSVCSYTHMSWDDPIVWPSQPGKAHLHTFVGNDGADAYSTTESLRATGGSTCRGGTANKSSYWQPALVVDGVPIKPAYSDVYWKTNYQGLEPSSIRPMPDGLRAVSSNSYWGCTSSYHGKPKVITACPAGEGIQAVVEFPQCSSGAVDSADHISHLTNPVGGRCPTTHPLPIPTITIKFSYPAELDLSKAKLSSDVGAVAPGSTLHGDIWEVFAPGIVEAFVAGCLNKGLDCKSHLLGDGRKIN